MSKTVSTALILLFASSAFAFGKPSLPSECSSGEKKNLESTRDFCREAIDFSPMDMMLGSCEKRQTILAAMAECQTHKLKKQKVKIRTTCQEALKKQHAEMRERFACS